MTELTVSSKETGDISANNKGWWEFWSECFVWYNNFSQTSIKDLFAKQSIRERKTEMFHCLIHSPHSQMLTTARTGPEWNHESGTTLRSPTWVARESWCLGHYLLPFQAHWQEAGSEIEQLGLLLALWYVAGGCLNHYMNHARQTCLQYLLLVINLMAKMLVSHIRVSGFESLLCSLLWLPGFLLMWTTGSSNDGCEIVGFLLPIWEARVECLASGLCLNLRLLL